MIALFVCGVFRVALVTAYLVACALRPELARSLMVPFAMLVWIIAIYDGWGQIKRSRSRR